MVQKFKHHTGCRDCVPVKCLLLFRWLLDGSLEAYAFFTDLNEEILQGGHTPGWSTRISSNLIIGNAQNSSATMNRFGWKNIAANKPPESFERQQNLIEAIVHAFEIEMQTAGYTITMLQQANGYKAFLLVPITKPAE